VDKLIASGVKLTPENVVATGTTPDGKNVWLESGNSDSGLQHIVAEHGSEFAAIGVPTSDLPGVLMNALTKGTIVGYQGSGTGRPIYQTTVNGQSYNIAISIGSNSYIVGANLRGRIR
jgi:filamentous hemagglutinin